ncbi:MAG TPA: AarF/ABC1/UbiB kinase family protein, partial [Nitrososphaeraceae archaeon]|nr:AarF/ABC1/UbiB kinase family protein [Nitrososphaeraceae archaeon]
EGLIKEAYIEEIKGSIKRFAKGMEASIRVAPLLRSYLETEQQHQNKSQGSYNFLAGMIFASALFIGSAMMVPYNLNLAYGGFISSMITLFASTLLKRRF